MVEAFPRNAAGEIRTEILQLIAMNQLDQLTPLISTASGTGARWRASSQNPRTKQLLTSDRCKTASRFSGSQTRPRRSSVSCRRHCGASGPFRSNGTRAAGRNASLRWLSAASSEQRAESDIAVWRAISGACRCNRQHIGHAGMIRRQRQAKRGWRPSNLRRHQKDRRHRNRPPVLAEHDRRASASR